MTITAQTADCHPLLRQADYVLDQQGNIKGVIFDWPVYQQIEKCLLDHGLGKAMEEAAEDEELDLETAKRLVNYKM